MHLIELFLPLSDNEGRAFGRDEFDRVRRELTGRFGGVTAFTRSPAEGAWREGDGGVTHDEVVVFEVMTDDLDRAWWAEYRDELTRRFRQEELLVRATATERL
jgi:hypothetical protein